MGAVDGGAPGQPKETQEGAPAGKAGAGGQAEPGATAAPGVQGGQLAPEGETGRGALARERERFQHAVARQAARAERFRREGYRGFWHGLSSFGMVGWSIAVPTLLGVALGLWLDRRAGGGVRFTISLMVAGLVIGMTNVWRWIRLQQEAEEEAARGEERGGEAGRSGNAGRGA